MAPTLAQLLVPQTLAQVTQTVLNALGAPQTNSAGQTLPAFPITDWEVGGVERTMALADATALQNLWTLVPVIAAGGLIDYATDCQNGWLALLGQQVYQLTANVATSTVGTVQLALASGNGPYTITAGQLWFQSSAGLRYTNTTGGTITAPGVSSVTHVGGGGGTVTVDATSVSSRNWGLSFTVTIMTGAATYTLAQSGSPLYGTSTTAAQAIPNGAAAADPLTGIVISFSGAFQGNDTYSFSVFGGLVLTAQSEHPNNSAVGLNYIDSNGTITTLLTPLPGLTAVNPAPDFSGVTLSGSGTGTVTPARHTLSSAPTASTVMVTILAQGQVGAATFKYNLNGTDRNGPFTTAASYADATLNAVNISLAFANGSLNPSFIANDVYTFTAPGSWITTQGTDAELDANYRLRCKARWPLLSLVPTLTAYQAMALAGSSQVTQAVAATDGTINNKVSITIAGQAGAVPASVVTAVQAYINARVPSTDLAVVVSASAQAITLAGTVTVKAAALGPVQAAAQQAVQNYLAGIGIGGTVRLADLFSAIMTGTYQGGPSSNPTLTNNIIDLSGLTINTVAANLALGAAQVTSFSQQLASALTWTLS